MKDEADRMVAGFGLREVQREEIEVELVSAGRAGRNARGAQSA